MFTPRWLLLVLAVALISSHALIVRYVLQHRSLSAATAVGVVILVVMTHGGLLGRLYSFLKRRFRQ